jgi:hypothetical protein
MSAPLRVLLLTDPAGYLAPIIPALTASGAEIVGHVAAPAAWKRRHRGDWRYHPVLARHAPDCLRLPFRGARDWPGVIAAQDRLAPDLVVSAFFPAHIPRPVHASARLGGVNLHPARLPWYRGAMPLHVLLQSDAEQHFGGMTLHVLSDRFDEGPIIAAATLAEDAWRTPVQLNAALAGAAASLCAGPLQDWAAGRITARAQPEGAFARARLGDLRPMDPRELTLTRLGQLLGFFRRGLELGVPGATWKSAGPLRRIGPPTGEPLRRLWPGRLQFDCADARVETLEASRLQRFVRRAVDGRQRARPTGPPIPPRDVLTADQNADAIAALAAAKPAPPGATVSA